MIIFSAAAAAAAAAGGGELNQLKKMEDEEDKNTNRNHELPVMKFFLHTPHYRCKSYQDAYITRWACFQSQLIS